MSATAVPIRVASWPAWYEPNRYLDLFYRALAPHGIEHVRDLPLDWRALSSAEINVSHLHWPEPFWRERRGVWRSPWFGVIALRRFLTGARRAGVRVVWTVHNLEHHDGVGLSDRLAYRMLHRRVDLRVFHSAWARDAALARYGGRGDRGERGEPTAQSTLVMPHGNYDGAIPAAGPRSTTLRAMAIPEDRKVLLCFGQVRPYKGFDIALAALDHLPATEFHLVIAGRAVGQYAGAVRAAARQRANVSLALADVEEQRLSDLITAADAVLLPYRRLTGSGVLLHALTLGKGVVVSDLPYFREVLDPSPEARVLAPAENPPALAAAIREFFRLPVARRGRAARGIAERYPWSQVVRPVAEWILTGSGSPPRGGGRRPAAGEAG